MMNTHNTDIKLIGETVTVSYVSDPSVGYGRFRLENYGAVAVTAAVESSWFECGGRQWQPFARVSVFDLDQDRMIDPESFTVEGQTILKFLLSIPKVTYEPRFGESSAVGLRLRVNNVVLQALSPIKFERRIPYGV